MPSRAPSVKKTCLNASGSTWLGSGSACSHASILETNIDPIWAVIGRLAGSVAMNLMYS